MITDSRLTPINRNYETCEECRVKLTVYPEHVHPDEITRILQLEPTKKNIIGTKITNSHGRTREITIAGWFLSSEQYVQSKDIRDHLDWLLSKVLLSKNGLIQLQNIEGIKMGIDCVWWSKGSGGPTLWPEQMKVMADLNLECSFDFYFFGEEE